MEVGVFIAAFLAGLVLFFGTHLYSAFRARGAGDVRARNPNLFRAVYSLLALTGFFLLVWGYGHLKPWYPVGFPVAAAPEALRHVTMLLMIPAFVFLAATYAPPGHIRKWVRHPMIASVKMWALAHLLVNWDAASLILFLSFLAFGVIDRIMLKRRGDSGEIAGAPRLAGDAIAVAVGLAAYVGFAFYLHPLLIGVPVTG